MIPTFTAAGRALAEHWRRWKGRPLAPESPFFWPFLLVFLWAFHGFTPRLIVDPMASAWGRGMSYDALIESSVPAKMLTRTLWALYYIGMVLVALRLSGLAEEDIGWKRSRASLAWSLLAGALAGAGFMLLKIYGWTPLVYSLRFWRPYHWTRHVAPITDQGFFPGDPGEVVYSLQNLLFFFPLIEELAYRGILYELFSRRYNRTAGALASSFLFACVHYRPGDFAYMAGIHLGGYGSRSMYDWGSIFVTGLLFCWLKERRNGLAAPIAAHTAGNMVAELSWVRIT